MSIIEESRSEIIERLVKHVIDKLPRDEAPLVRNFIQLYYLSVSAEDLNSRSVLDLYGAVVSHWNFISVRQPGEIKIRVYNPNLEQHGWQSTHTVIEIGFDDMPFLVDSVAMELNRMELNIHIIIHMGNINLRRDEHGKVIEVAEDIKKPGPWITEAAIYIEIDRQSDPEVLDEIANRLRLVLRDVQIVVNDWPKMQVEARKILQQLREHPAVAVDKSLFDESLEFINWVAEDHFTFMGYQSYTIEGEDENLRCRLNKGSSLGKLNNTDQKEVYSLSDFTEAAQNLIFSKQIIMLGKTNRRSTVHRPAYIDFIIIKIFDNNGKLTALHRFDGLYTAVAYNSSPQHIPYLRLKVNRVLMRAGFPPKSHDDRALLNILETIPRDDLFQSSEDELLALGTGILHLQERQKIRLFVRKETFGNFYSCLVYVPRDTYNSDLREKMQDILMKGLDGLEVEFTTRFSESTLARIHFVMRIDVRKKAEKPVDVKALEQKLIEAGRSWKDDLRDALYDHAGEERGNELFKRYGNAFPGSYCESFPARAGIVDIDYFETLSNKNPLMMSLYRPLEEPENVIRFKLFRIGSTIPLSDVVPILENLGLRIISERPYEILPRHRSAIWINDYRMILPKEEAFDAEEVREIFQEAFDHIWKKEAENDGFNRLVLLAKLNWREISVLRAFAKYLWQAGFTLSQNYIEDTLVGNHLVTAELIKLFKLRFDPEYVPPEAEIMAQRQKILDSLEKVMNLNEDRVLRRYLDMILAVIRTNYYQKQNVHELHSDHPFHYDSASHHHDELIHQYDSSRTNSEPGQLGQPGQSGQENQSSGFENSRFKPYFSFKIESSKIPELPQPVPLYEIFVYSPRVEGIHLRAAKVARGGIRWSDRKEDFRTEVLGLMKAQQVKNAVIVPMGAKGGFVAKNLPNESLTRDQVFEEVEACYQVLIRGMLDLTDNLKADKVIPPVNIVRYDNDDPYLVVAADKGTATFSDIANTLSAEYDFWLGDAFASGGSTGYDHKKMGITARGAWESVKRHFHEMGMDSQTEDFTAIGIGDMSGDVFGNGMLLSRHIRLIAAFNHMHIFIDPNPDAEKSFLERERLFNVPRSAWSDYNSELISPGGGVFSRTAKSITLSKEIQKALDFYQERVAPNELVRAILKAPVELFFNGGIGTYVKARSETNLSVGDRANDAVRINGSELRTKVVCEGGNLGLTQLGRIEYAKLGGRINTDAIDNSGGVNCSDNEVNIKILLNDVVEHGDLTEKQRNELLAEMTNEVAELVLYNNRHQTEAISIAESQAVANLEMHSRLIQEMERSGNLDRALEFLPDKEEIADRKSKGIGLTRPELAVLMAYTKTLLKKSIGSSDILEEPAILKNLFEAFPKVLHQRFEDYMLRHRLRKDIIATRVSNGVINEMGISFISRLEDETGSGPPDIIRAYTIAKEVFDAPKILEEINALTPKVESHVQLRMIQEVNRLVRRGTRWFLRNRRSNLNIDVNIKQFHDGVKQVSDILPTLLSDSEYEMETMAKAFMEFNVPGQLAYQIGAMTAMFSALDIVEAAITHKYDVSLVAAIYYAVGNTLELGWFREMIKKQPITSHWEALARATFRDDLDRQQRNITVGILHMNGTHHQDVSRLIEQWAKKNKPLVDRWKYFIAELKNVSEPNFTMFSVALRELLDMSQMITHKKRAADYLCVDTKEIQEVKEAKEATGIKEVLDSKEVKEKKQK